MDKSFNSESRSHSFSAVQLHELLGAHRVSGKIQVTSGPDVYSLYVERGQILAATCSHRTLRLGHLLLQRGAVEPIYLHDVLVGRRSVPLGRALGGALIAEGAVTRAALLATIEDQISEVLSCIIGLENATIIVIADEPLPIGIERADFDTESLFDEADRRQTRRMMVRAMQRLLPANTHALVMAEQLGAISNQLSDAELLVALQIDKGSATLERLGTGLPLDPMKLKRILIGLMERGFIATARI